MVDVKSDKICRLEIIIDHAERLKVFLAEYGKKYGHIPGWGDPLADFVRVSKIKLGTAIVEAYKVEARRVRGSTGSAKNEA